MGLPCVPRHASTPWWVTVALFATLSAVVDARVPVPGLKARVTDLTGTLTAAQQSSLEEKLRAFEARKGAQVVVLVLPTTEPEDIAQFGIRLADAWKIGREGPDDGAILIVALQDRALRIEVGRGLEGSLTDATASRIIHEAIVPLFKQGDFFGGVNVGVDQMLRVIDGEALPAPDPKWKSGDLGGLLALAATVGVIALGLILRPLAGRAGGAAIAALVPGGYIWKVSSNVWIALAFFAWFFMFTGAIGSWGRRGGGRRGGGGSVFLDRIFEGGGGHGGFSGGGGSFAGGGASGRW